MTCLKSNKNYIMYLRSFKNVLIGRDVYIQLKSISAYLKIHKARIAECPKQYFDLKVPTPMKSETV